MLMVFLFVLHVILSKSSLLKQKVKSKCKEISFFYFHEVHFLFCMFFSQFNLLSFLVNLFIIGKHLDPIKLLINFTVFNKYRLKICMNMCVKVSHQTYQ